MFIRRKREDRNAIDDQCMRQMSSPAGAVREPVSARPSSAAGQLGEFVSERLTRRADVRKLATR